MIPVSPPCTILSSPNPAAGLNPLFDTFDCQEHFFASPEPGRVFAKINWRIPSSDPLTGDEDFIERSVTQRFVQEVGAAIERAPCGAGLPARGGAAEGNKAGRLQGRKGDWVTAAEAGRCAVAPRTASSRPPLACSPSCARPCPPALPVFVLLFQDPATPAVLVNKDNEYLNYQDTWWACCARCGQAARPRKLRGLRLSPLPSLPRASTVPVHLAR
jgi:hypothetical protein